MFNFVRALTYAVDGEDFFIRGVLVIPVEGAENGLGFSVWINQKQENFQDYVDNPDSADMGQYFGWLTTAIQPYAPTLGFKTMAWFRGNTQRPLIELEPTDHPFSIDCQNGISLERARKIIHECM